MTSKLQNVSDLSDKVLLNQNSTLDLFPSETESSALSCQTSKNDVQTGESGEFLTISKLLKWGYKASPVSSGHAYDIVVEDAKGRLLRIQVKTSSTLKSRYSFSFVRGFYYSPKGNFDYANDDYDISACVNLHDEKVLFSAGVEKSISWKRDQFMRDNYEKSSWENACSEINKGARQ